MTVSPTPHTAPTAVPVVFIPALLCDAAMYRDVIERLGDAIDAQVLVSPRATLQESVADLLDRMPERCVLVGTSYGGNVAMALALAAPERVVGLVLAGCDPGAAAPGGPDLAGALEAVPDVVIDKLAGVVVRQGDDTARAAFKAMAGRIGAPAGAQQARAVAAREDVVERLAALGMPALVLWGADDAAIPVSTARTLADALPDAELVLLPDCGHLPTLERPAESAEALRRLLARVPRAG